MAWTTIVTDDISAIEGNLWRNPVISPSSASFLAVGQAVEDLLVDPEDITLEPEKMQNDDTGWVLLPGPT